MCHIFVIRNHSEYFDLGSDYINFSLLLGSQCCARHNPLAPPRCRLSSDYLRYVLNQVLSAVLNPIIVIALSNVRIFATYTLSLGMLAYKCQPTMIPE